jgi:hypothetical protein
MKKVEHLGGPSVGTLIAGTMRPQDLIPCFLEAVSEFAPAHYEGLMASAFGPIPAYVQDEGDSSEWWQSEDAAALLENLFDILHEAAPEGCYFGAHPGDGSDFGWWNDSELFDTLPSPVPPCPEGVPYDNHLVDCNCD